MSGERVTIVLDEDNMTRLRKKQAKRISTSEKSVSFSRVLNDELRGFQKVKVQRMNN